MERKEYTCEYCGDVFKSGKWLGCDADQFKAHTVKPITYYSEHANHIKTLTKEKNIVSPTTGEAMKIPGTAAEFTNGQYTTNNPEAQEILNRMLEVGSLITYQAYIDSKLTEKQKTARANTDLKETSALLAKKEEELAKLKEENARLKARPPKASKPEMQAEA